MTRHVEDDPRDEVQHAHATFVAAINANDADAALDQMTEDAVLLAPGSAAVIGKQALRSWIEAYLAAFSTCWDKPVQECVVNGDWAFQRYTWISTDTPRGGGESVIGTGWGLALYRREADGRWRVARDAWGSDQPG